MPITNYELNTTLHTPWQADSHVPIGQPGTADYWGGKIYGETITPQGITTNSPPSAASYNPVPEYANLANYFSQMFSSIPSGGGGAVTGNSPAPVPVNIPSPTPVSPPTTTTPDATTTKDPGSNFLSDSLTGGGSYAQQLMDQYMASMSGPAGGVETYGYGEQ